MSERGLRDILDIIGGSLRGREAGGVVRGISPPDEAAPDHLALYLDGRYGHLLGSTRAMAVLTDETHAGDVIDAGLAAWVHPDPRAALEGLVDMLYPVEEDPAPPFDHGRGLWIARSASIGEGAILGPACSIHDDVVVGPGTRIDDHAVLLRGACVGSGCAIGPGAFVGPRVRIGDRVTIGPGASIGPEGFGLRIGESGWIPVRHVGTVLLEDEVGIGARTVVARATLGTTRIGRATRIDAQVQIGHNARIGPGCAIAAQVGIAGSATIGASVLIGGQAGIADHIRVGEGARIAARSGVASDVPAGATVEGYPAVDRWTWLRMIATLKKLVEG